MNFKSLGLSSPILRAIADAGYTCPTPIQAQAIPAILEGRDVLGCAQTGTGKTAAFTLPILDRLAANPPAGARRDRQNDNPRPNRHQRRRKRSHHAGGDGRIPRALVVCPTRELAGQILDSTRTYGQHAPVRTTAVFGGVGINGQKRRLESGVDLVVATPGRLIDLMNQGCINLSSIRTLVLDEADRMLDMGFLPDIRRIAEALPKRRQTLLFSATMPRQIRGLIKDVLTDPLDISVTPVASAAPAISQSVYHVEHSNKTELLQRLIQGGSLARTIVFTRTKHGADRLAKNLNRSGVRSEAIHGDKSQGARNRALKSFRDGKVELLVATDVASRGIDVDGISHVINYDMPYDPESYVHRIGRTARAGSEGIAISFCTPQERGSLRAIERLIDDRIDVADDQPDLRPARDSRDRNDRHDRPRGGNRNRRPSAGAPKRSRQSGNGRPSGFAKRGSKKKFQSKSGGGGSFGKKTKRPKQRAR